MTNLTTKTLLHRAWAELADGRERQVPGAFERAKDYATAALRELESADLPLTDAQNCLAYAYWRLGELDNALAVLTVAIEVAASPLERIKLRNTLALVHYFSGRLEDVCELARRNAAEAEAAGDAGLMGRSHGHHANALRDLGETDRACEEYTASIIYFELANEDRNVACSKNNLAMLLSRKGRYEQAHEELSEAFAIARRLKDRSALGQLEHTLSEILEAQEDYYPALEAADRSLSYLTGDEAKLREQSEETRGRILSKLGIEGVRPLVEEKLMVFSAPPEKRVTT